MDIIDNIYQVFKDYYGEARVDLQKKEESDVEFESGVYVYNEDYIILVHWPKVTVTNEYDASVNIWGFYAAIPIAETGRLKSAPTFNRNIYDRVQWDSDYQFSHTCGVNKRYIKQFRTSCLGRGPLVHTKERLVDDPNAYTDYDMWNLFCWELDKYVHVESLIGVPYRKLQEIGTSRNGGSMRETSAINIEPCSTLCAEMQELLKVFIKEVIDNKLLKFSYSEGRYTLATSLVETAITLSNAFIDMYNSKEALRILYPKDTLMSNNFLRSALISNGRIVEHYKDSISIDGMLGTHMFTFKGNPVRLSLTTSESDYSSNEVILINPIVINYIVYQILKYINLYYGKSVDTINKKSRVV